MKYSSAEVKSGLFIVISFILLFALTFVVGRYVAGETNVWTVRYGYISGLEENAPVFFAGREAGKVDKIEIMPGDVRPIRVTIRLSTEVLIREDSQAFIDMLGLMGEKFIEISPGTEGAPYAKPGFEIPGVDPVPLHVMMAKMNVLTDRFDEMMIMMNPMLAKVSTFVEGHEEDIARSIANIHQITANVRDLTEDLKHHPWRLVRKNS